MVSWDVVWHLKSWRSDLGDIILENPMPLHFYGITNGSKLSVIKPYVTVSVEDNHGDVICKRLNRKDTIQEVKVKLSSSTRSPSPIPARRSSRWSPSRSSRSLRKAAEVTTITSTMPAECACVNWFNTHSQWWLLGTRVLTTCDSMLSR